MTIGKTTRFFRNVHTRLVPFEGKKLVVIQRESKTPEGIRRFVTVPGFYVGLKKTSEGVVTEASTMYDLAQMKRAKLVVAAQPGLVGGVYVHIEP